MCTPLQGNECEGQMEPNGEAGISKGPSNFPKSPPLKKVEEAHPWGSGTDDYNPASTLSSRCIPLSLSGHDLTQEGRADETRHEHAEGWGDAMQLCALEKANEHHGFLTTTH